MQYASSLRNARFLLEKTKALSSKEIKWVLLNVAQHKPDKNGVEQKLLLCPQKQILNFVIQLNSLARKRVKCDGSKG